MTRSFRNLTIAVLGLSALSLAGCATPNYSYVPVVQDISRPPLGSVNTVGVGEQMLVQGRFEERDALVLDRDIQVGAIGTYTFTVGHFLRVGGNGDVGFYNESPVSGSGRVQQGILADPFQVIEYNSATKQLCGVTILNLKTCKRIEDARVERIAVQSTNSFQQTLIYSGRVGNKINIGYREFSGSVARPAFNNDVEYDLDASKIIGYMGAQIEVIRATNQDIEYRVIKNFNIATR